MKATHVVLSLLLAVAVPLVAFAEDPSRQGTEEVTLWLHSPQGVPLALDNQDARAIDGSSLELPTSVLPGTPIEWMITLHVSQDNLGLAMFSADLEQAPENPQWIDLPPGDGAPTGMEMFDRPRGFTNPGKEAGHSAYGGSSRVGANGVRNVTQIGGAQNIFGRPGPCFGVEALTCMGQDVLVASGIGQGNEGQIVATGRFVAPETAGSYVFTISSAMALVLEEVASPPESSSARAATVGIAGGGFRIQVVTEESAADSKDRSTRSAPPSTVRVLPARSSLRPTEGAVLNYTHVGFWWDPGVDPEDGEILQIVVDDGSPDPFFADPSGIMSHELHSTEPRRIVTSGLAFGQSYAWRVLGSPSVGSGVQVGPIHRFQTAELPDNTPTVHITRLEPGELEPGVTLFNVYRFTFFPRFGPLPSGMALAIDETGEIVFFLSKPPVIRGIGLIERGASGRLSMIRGLPSPQGILRALYEETLDGRVLWKTPLDREYEVHHDFDITANGDPLLLLADYFESPLDPGTTYGGDRIVMLNRQSMEETWSWRTADHYSIFDGQVPNTLKWSHGNAVFYDEPSRSVYFSARHFSRISRIDFDSGEIIYNMGSEMPSGDTDFGDGLFSYQHAPSLLPNGNMLLFDNANRSPSHHSRAIEIAFDNPELPTSATIVGEWGLNDEFGNPVFCRFAGDADRLPGGNTLLSATASGIIVEVDPEGRSLWLVRLESSASLTSVYRSQRLPSLIVDSPGDCDGDGDLDLLDFAALQERFGVESSPLSFPERLSDFDGDGEIDTEDVKRFTYWMSGPAD